MRKLVSDMTYYTFMLNYTAFFETVREQEKEKLEAILSNDLPRIRAALNAQQLLLKKIESMEAQRLALQTELGLEGKNLRETAQAFYGDEKRSIFELGIRLDRIVKSIQYFNKKSLEIADKQMQFYGEDDSSYDAKGKPGRSKSGLFSSEA
ncbi:MAG: hypothetical protein QM689_07560 [Oscillospiraceae bacterium]